VGSLAGRYALQLFTVAGLVVLCVAQPNFRQLGNLRSVLLQASFSGLSAAAMTLLIVAGMFDLSVAGIVALSAVTVATVMPHTVVGAAVAAALLLGLVLGLLNGFVVTKFRFPPFIATYGMLNLYLAAAFVWTAGATVPIAAVGFLPLASAQILGLPLLFVIMVIGVLVCHVVLTRTRLGRNLRAIGSSEPASRMAGLPVDRTRIVAFGLVGLFTAVAGVGLAALLSSASADMSLGFELTVIAVAVVGGTSLEGGRGSLLGTLTAAILFSALNNALNLLNVTSYWQYVATGLVLILALVIAGLRHGRLSSGHS
jgi:ribose/xylose/arabinose/galactoside ABC-type transport system permease subunit